MKEALASALDEAKVMATTGDGVRKFKGRSKSVGTKVKNTCFNVNDTHTHTLTMCNNGSCCGSRHQVASSKYLMQVPRRPGGAAGE